MPSIGNSDHDIVLLDTTIQAQRPKPAKRKIQLWKRANIEGIKEDVANFVEDFNQTVFENIEQMWKLYKDKLLEILTNKHVPSKMTTTKFTHPWINTDIKKLIRSKKRHTKSKENKEEKG
jgi:hypothetical protein